MTMGSRTTIKALDRDCFFTRHPVRLKNADDSVYKDFADAAKKFVDGQMVRRAVQLQLQYYKRFDKGEHKSY
jgi:hypothetical protein